MSEQDNNAFLAMIWSTPENTPWLVFADYLDEHGDPLGEYIRVQCELSTLEPPTNPRLRMPVNLQAMKLEKRRELLETEHGRYWNGPAAWLARHWWFRGMLHRLLSAKTGHLDLHIQDLGDAGAAALAACPLLETVRILNLSYTGIRSAGIETFLKSPYIKSLTTLDLSWNEIGSSGVSVLANCDRLPQLRVLTLSYCSLDPESVTVLVDSPLVKQLQFLDLRSNFRLTPSYQFYLRTKLRERVIVG